VPVDRKAYLRDYDANRRDKAKVVRRNKSRRLEHKLRLVEMFGGVCMDCQQAWPPYIMEFDHRDPAEKSFTVSGAKLQWAFDKLVEEALKCDLVCSNCHRVRTHKQICEGCEYCG
jgi:hypothetical protein